jgi:hypothetical protein
MLVTAALVAALAGAAGMAPAAVAIGNGVPDGDGHPDVGLMAVEHDGIREAWCSGFYAGRHEDDPGTGVFVTAGHCLADVAAIGYESADLTVTFDTNARWDIDTFATTATGWHPAAAYDFAVSKADDYGVILLAGPVPGLSGLKLPAAGLLDDLAARGGLRPQSLFDTAGYGFVPHFKRGPATYTAPPGRMVATSRYSALTKTELLLLDNADAGYGGGCYGDSGGPVLPAGSRTVVAIQAGGDPRCRAKASPERLDTAAARAFLGRFLRLP